MLVELGLVEQRHKAVLEVLDGAAVMDVARRYGVSRQSVHAWLRRYANQGLAALAGRSSRPDGCPHQMPAGVEARVVGLRLAHPGWGPRTIRSRLAGEGVDPLPGRSSVYRCLVRHGLVEVARRRRRRDDYRRWERSKAMELWQMDVVGRFHLADGTELHALTGVDDHSRFCVCAALLARATARPVCERLEAAFAVHGVPDQILTDNGKVFTARFGTGPGPTLFDRICAQNGVRHLLTAPRSPTTTGKIERFHKTWRREFVAVHDYQHASVAEAQAALDAWVVEYNTVRPHQSLGIARRWSGSVWPGRVSSPSMSTLVSWAGGVPCPGRSSPGRSDPLGGPQRAHQHRPPRLQGGRDLRRGNGGGGRLERAGGDLPPPGAHRHPRAARPSPRWNALSGRAPLRLGLAAPRRGPASLGWRTATVPSASPGPCTGPGGCGPGGPSRSLSWPDRYSSPWTAKSSACTPPATTRPRNTAHLLPPTAGPATPRPTPRVRSVKQLPEPNCKAGTGT